ncbi:MAG: hypothetical protein MZV70_13560 [Desulfobacterales bacterium]|nr:hypothetical protein [Desulfobacterales bacterium]
MALFMHREIRRGRSQPIRKEMSTSKSYPVRLEHISRRLAGLIQRGELSPAKNQRDDLLVQLKSMPAMKRQRQ